MAAEIGSPKPVCDGGVLDRDGAAKSWSRSPRALSILWREHSIACCEAEHFRSTEHAKGAGNR